MKLLKMKTVTCLIQAITNSKLRTLNKQFESKLTKSQGHKFKAKLLELLQNINRIVWVIDM